MRPAHHIHLVYFFILILALVFAGCVTIPKPVMKDAAPVIEKPTKPMGNKAYPDDYYIHTVSVPDENLSIIAHWYTGQQKNWTVLVECNPTIKPNRIFLGNKIRIPRSIMTRQIPLTPEFVQQSHAEPQQKRKKKISQAKTKTAPVTPVKEEDSLLFGPKGY